MYAKKIVKSCIAVLLSVSLLSSLSFPTKQADAALVSGEKFLGNVIASRIPANFATYWNQATPENASKWGPVEETRDTMNWANVDLIYNYCKTNNFPFKFHTLVWGSQEPVWMTSIPAAEKKEEVLEWMDAAAAKYADAEFIDVVNEPLHAKPSFKDAIGGDGSTGWDWVIWSFQEARKRFKGKLLINEYGVENDPGQCANYVKIINLLKEKNLIDGIGIQCHQFNLDTTSASTLRSTLNTLAATGLPIYVSELDLTGDDATQLARYKEKFPIYWEHPSVKGVTLWGYLEGTTWKENTHLMTTANAERPALAWLREYLKSPVTPQPTYTPAPTPTPDLTQRNAFSVLEAENYSLVSAATIEKAPTANGGMALGYIANGNYTAYNNVDFGAGTTTFQAYVASGSTSTTNIEIRLGSPTGTLVGTLYVSSTGGWNAYQLKTTSINRVTGVHNVYLKYTGPVNFDWFTFATNITPTPPSTPTPSQPATPTPSPTPSIKTKDLNGDKAINMADIMLVAGVFNAVRGDGKFRDDYDLNNDGALNMADIMMIATEFNTVLP